uniref:Secreted protein n=1 Tax=Rhipicephalus zambeziensis TaxID=60191 RepID=A0A224Y7B5_9ACAR
MLLLHRKLCFLARLYVQIWLDIRYSTAPAQLGREKRKKKERSARKIFFFFVFPQTVCDGHTFNRQFAQYWYMTSSSVAVSHLTGLATLFPSFSLFAYAFDLTVQHTWILHTSTHLDQQEIAD